MGYRRFHGGGQGPNGKEDGREFPPGVLSKRIRCNGMSRQTGFRCANYAVPGRNYCKYHGGHAGGYDPIKYAGVIKSAKLRDRYLELAKDTNLTDMKDDLALLKAMMMTLAERFLTDEGEAEIGVDKMQAISSLVRDIRNLVKVMTDTEVKRKYLVSLDDIESVTQSMLDALKKHIKDPEVVRLIIADVTAAAVPAPPGLPPGEDD